MAVSMVSSQESEQELEESHLMLKNACNPFPSPIENVALSAK
jgi:hypothetical protein